MPILIAAEALLGVAVGPFLKVVPLRLIAAQPAYLFFVAAAVALSAIDRRDGRTVRECTAVAYVLRLVHQA
jgi:hypothetical protein